MNRKELITRIEVIQAVTGLTKSDLAAKSGISRHYFANLKMEDRIKNTWDSNIPRLKKVFPRFFAESIVVSFSKNGNYKVSGGSEKEITKHYSHGDLKFPELTMEQKVDELYHEMKKKKKK